MTIWRLIPIDPLDPNWEASTHRGPAVVRAPDEKAARDVAAHAFDAKTRFKPGAGTLAPPWRRAQSVRAETIADSRYAIDGPTEVLEPTV
jgi:hypothetical protein